MTLRKKVITTLLTPRRIDNLEATLSLLIIKFFAPLWLSLYKSAADPMLAANHRQDHSHPCSQFGRGLADWPVSCMPSHVPAYS